MSTFLDKTGLNTLWEKIKFYIAKYITDTTTTGFNITDNEGNIGLSYNEDGLDVAKVTDHFLEVVTLNISQSTIANKFAVFTTVEDMFACGVYANKDKTQLYDADHEIHSQTIDSTYQEKGTEIPYDNVCFIRRNNCTFVGGRCMGTPLRTVHLKDLVTSTKTTDTVITVEGATFNCSEDITLDAGDYIIYHTGKDDDIAKCVVKYNTKTNTWDIKALPLAASGFDNPIKYSCTQETTIRIIDANEAGATMFHIYKTSSVKSAKRIERDKARAELCKKVIVHRAVPTNAQIGSIYFINLSPHTMDNIPEYSQDYTAVIWVKNNDVFTMNIPCGDQAVYIICKITPDVIRYNLDRTRKPFDNSCDEYLIGYNDGVSKPMNYIPRSPYFEISDGHLSCIKTLDEYTQRRIIYQIHNRNLNYERNIDIRHLRCVGTPTSHKGNECSETYDEGGRYVKWRNVFNVGHNSRRHGMIKITPKVRGKYKSVNSYIYRNRARGKVNPDYTSYYSSFPYNNWSMMRI